MQTISLTPLHSDLDKSFPGLPKIILPQSSNDDERITPIFELLRARLERNVNLRFEVEVKNGRDVKRGDDGVVLLPCIAASRVGSDLNAAAEKAKISEAGVPQRFYLFIYYDNVYFIYLLVCLFICLIYFSFYSSIYLFVFFMYCLHLFICAFIY